jgi:transmembrane sensor
MTSKDEVIRGAIAEQAAEWFIAHQAGPLPAEARVAFLAWLRDSPRHVEAYLGVARVAGALAEAVGHPQVPLEAFLAQQNSDDANVVELPTRVLQRQRVASRRAPSWGGALAASLVALVATALWWAHDGELFRIPKSYRTTHGQQTGVSLPDGSAVQLDSDSAVTVRYSGRERLVTLDQGRAMFTVSHDGARRFRVAAGSAGAIAVGTQFEVAHTGSATVITVAEGVVAAFAGEPAWLQRSGQIPALVVRVSAGYQVRVDGGVMSEQPAAADLRQEFGWLQHKIVFERRPLAEVAAEFNRYARIPVQIEDNELKALPVSGNFDADDVDSFIAFLATLPGVRVEATPTQIRVLRPTPRR